jgi:hypothetical protein
MNNRGVPVNPLPFPSGNLPPARLTKVRYGGNQETALYWGGDPDQCPLCHTSLVPRFVAHTFSGTSNNGRLQAIFQCPSGACERAFIATYQRGQLLYGEKPVSGYVLANLEPKTPEQQEFNPVIQEVSPSFASIYNQALAAECMGLRDICGVGYRKALEFLLKDFLIHQEPHREESIRNTIQLGTCIQNFVTEERIRQCARRAVALGNDETHYDRRWVDQDVEDLKTLIHLTVLWVEGVLLTARYVTEMPDRPST